MLSSPGRGLGPRAPYDPLVGRSGRCCVVTAHGWLAAAVAVLAVALGAIVLLDLTTGRSGRRAQDRLILGALAVVGVAILTGLVLLVTGHVPTDPLHVLYAVAALVALPIARF